MLTQIHVLIIEHYIQYRLKGYGTAMNAQVVESGRHAWLRAMWEFPVWVQVPPWAHSEARLSATSLFYWRDFPARRFNNGRN